MKEGIDVSSYQGSIDWQTVKPNIDFVILRCGFGNDIKNQDDTFFEQNRFECERLQIPYGVYLYSYATNLEMAQSEVEHTLRLIKDAKLEYPVFLDVEDKVQLSLPKEKLIEIVKYYCEKMTENGYYVGIYASANTFHNQLDSSQLDNYDSWVAEWNDTLSYTKPCGMWQYTNKQILEGIHSVVDADIAYYNYPQIIKEKGLNHLIKKESDTNHSNIPSKPLPSEKEPTTPLSTHKYKVGDTVYINNHSYTTPSAEKNKKKYCNRKIKIVEIMDNTNNIAPYKIADMEYAKEEDLTPVKLTKCCICAKIIAFIKKLVQYVRRK